MKILFFNGYNVTPHLETEMEIAMDLMNEGKEVYFTHCKGELSTCFANPDHNKRKCKNCGLRKQNAISLLGLPEENVVQFPRPSVDIDEIKIPSFTNLSELKEFNYEGVDIGMAVASSLVSVIRDHQLDPLKYKNEIENGIRTALFVYESGKMLLDIVKPDEVVIFNGRFAEIRPFMRLCEQKNIKYYSHERGGSMHTYLVRENDIPHSLNAIQNEIISLWGTGGPHKEEIGEKFFQDRRNRVIQSWHVFTKNQQKGQLPLQFDRTKKNIAIFNSSMDEYEGIAGFANKIYSDDNAGIRALLESFKENKSVHFYLRMHPNLKGLQNSQTFELKQIGEAFSNITIIPAEATVDSYALMEAVNIVTAFNSTIGAEASYWKKPVVLLGTAAYCRLSGFYKPDNHEQAVQMLNQDLKPIIDKDILKYGYWEISKGSYFKYYIPEGLDKGSFLGKKTKLSVLRKILSRCGL